jgi:hypothetical protein
VRQLAAAFVSQYYFAAKAQASLRTPNLHALLGATLRMKEGENL